MIKRWLITFAVAWLLGCVVTVLVAWCCTVRGGSDGDWETLETPAWPAPTPEGWPSRPVEDERLNRSSIFGGIDFESAAGYTEDSYMMSYHMQVARAGWPFRAMRTVSWYISEWDGDESYESEPFMSGISVAPHRTRSSIETPYYDSMAPMHLPAAPLWPGFVANSALAAGLILAIASLFRFGTPQRARSRSRRVATVWIVRMLAIGAIASIVTALAMWSRWQMQVPQPPLSDGWGSYRVAESGPMKFLGDIRSLEWPAMPPTSWPARPNVFHHYGDWYGVTACGYLDDRETFSGRSPGIEYERFNAAVDQAGWPMRCLESVDFVEFKRDLTWTRTVGPMGIELPLHSSTPWPGEAGAVLPLGPIWLGLLANTLFYGYLIALPMLSVRAVRVVRRRRRGACESCGYSRAGLDAAAACPECGAANTLAS